MRERRETRQADSTARGNSGDFEEGDYRQTLTTGMRPLLSVFDEAKRHPNVTQVRVMSVTSLGYRTSCAGHTALRDVHAVYTWFLQPAAVH